MNFEKPVSHETFMRRALYDPVSGYYANRAKVGKSGDFSTSATLSSAFSEAVADWVATTAERLEMPSTTPIIELGAGDGSMAVGLSDIIPHAELHLVETSAELRSRQNLRLSDRHFQHHDDLKSALSMTHGSGLIVANEFIDAFPAVKLRWQENDWWEVLVSIDGEQVEETLVPLERDIDADAPAHPKEGETIYVQPTFYEWLRENTASHERGAILFIDYGADRPSHECRAYAEQERFEGLDIYLKAGTRDVTCDVNFVDLARWCRQLGYTVLETETQAEFLESHLEDLESRKKIDEALAYLSNPFGAGGAFRVLIAERS